ncbi:MAG: LuxR C-terminal-related transcriptional regulator [Micromonosporaceae bacterium]
MIDFANQKRPPEKRALWDHSAAGDSCLRAYWLALRRGNFVDREIVAQLGVSLAEVERVRRILVELRLLAPHPATDSWVPVRPDIAESELSGPHEQAIRISRNALDDIHHKIAGFALHYRRHLLSQAGGSPVRAVGDRDGALRELTMAARACTREVMAMEPSARWASDHAHLLQPRSLAAPGRGVAVRMLCEHPTGTNVAAQTYLREIVQGGALVRTGAEVLDRLTIFDRQTAFVSHECEDGWGGGATIVHDRNLVAFLCRSYERAWAVAELYDPDEPECKQGTTAIQTSIMRLMAAGMKDEVVARRLGIATRTCRRYISLIMDDLGAVSRFQAGVKAAQAGLLPTDLS